MINILSWLALIFLTSAGYSAGAVLGSRIRASGQKVDPSPSFLDTMMVVILWVGGIASRLSGVNTWSVVGIWIIVALVLAFILNSTQKKSEEGKQLPQ